MMVIEHISIECRKTYIREITSTRWEEISHRANENEKWKKQNKNKRENAGKREWQLAICF